MVTEVWKSEWWSSTDWEGAQEASEVLKMFFIFMLGSDYFGVYTWKIELSTWYVCILHKL